MCKYHALVQVLRLRTYLNNWRATNRAEQLHLEVKPPSMLDFF